MARVLPGQPCVVTYRYRRAFVWRGEATAASPLKVVFVGTLEECREFYVEWETALCSGGCQIRKVGRQLDVSRGARLLELAPKARRPSFAAAMRELERELDL